MFHRSILKILLLFTAVCLIADKSFATPPRLISYQGRVTDNANNPLTQNGVSFRFLIYKDSTGGSFMWAEVTSKDVVGGQVTHTLGSLVNLPDSLFTNYDALWLELLVDGQPIQPRTRLIASPRTASLHGSAGGTITSDVLIQASSNGNGLEVSQSGLGRSGRFSIENPSNTSEALVAITQGSGQAGFFSNNGGGSAVEAYAIASGYALYGAGGKGVYGVVPGTNDSSKAIHGVITSASPGSYSAAVRGQNLGTAFTGIGVWGSHGGQGWGVYGTSDGVLGNGVRGSSATGSAIFGTTTSGISGNFNGGRVTISGASDASIGNVASGYLVLGSTGGTNIVIDNNELMARNNGLVTELHLQAEGGSVAIGLQGIPVPSGYILAVDGKAIMEEVEVQLSNNWPDYVFEPNYHLMPLEGIEAHIRDQGHLPGIPSADKMNGGRLALGKMQTKLLEKIEELTLYVIGLNKQVSELKLEKQALESRIGTLESEGKQARKMSGL